MRYSGEMRHLLVLWLLAAPLVPVLAQEFPLIPATDLDQLREKAGNEVVVEGEVISIGKTSTGTLTFINVGLPKKQGFVALVKQGSYPAFPNGFDAYQGQKVRVKGVITLYRETNPQIEITGPDQITIVAPPVAE